MNVLVCGSRTMTDYEVTIDYVKKVFDKLHIDFSDQIRFLSGGAIGPDRHIIAFALTHKIPYTVFKPQWKRYGRGAGLIRNVEMVDIANMVIAIWDGKSKGTKHTIEYAKGKKLPVYIGP